MLKENRLLSLMLWLLLVVSTVAGAQGYDIAPTPSWVVSVESPRDNWVESSPGSNGTAYLLVDRQWSLADGRQRFYNHQATKAITSAGVESVSGITIDFDPLYESLTLHGVVVWRDGMAQDRLDRSRISLIQREQDLERQLYDGSLTLNLILEDVRPGDTVEYSYTIEGANPIFDGHFSQRLNLRWTVPVGRLHYRLLWPSDRPLHLRNHISAIKPIKRVMGAETEYLWLRDRVPSLQSDNNTPSWYQPYPKIVMSDMADWDEVVAWALPLYEPTPVSETELTLIDELIQPGMSREQQLLTTLDFVQEQIRYLGLEMGESSHRPSLPSEVLERRYGDCKDKTRLLVSLLSELGIEAYPALVNTNSGVYLADTLPTQHAFDHVIVLVRMNGGRYWIDPTRTHQAGDLAHLYQPDYDYALVVAENGGGLVKMTPEQPVVHSKQIEEFFDISSGVESPVSLRILNRHQRYYADQQRQALAETDLEALQKSYWNYIAGYYPSIEVADPMTVKDSPSDNQIEITEYYRITQGWKPQGNSGYVTMTFEPTLIDDHLPAMDSPKRGEPYAVTHPVSYRHNTRIRVPEGSDFQPERYEVNDSAFRFTKTVDFDGSELLIDYHYQSLSDHVMPKDIPEHAEHLKQAYNLTSYQVSMIDPAVGYGEYRFDAGDVNWMLVTTTLISLLVFGLLVYRFVYLVDPKLREDTPTPDPALRGIKGWLILPAIFISLMPLIIAAGFAEYLYLYSDTQWELAKSQTSPGMIRLILSEVVLNQLLLVLSIFLLIMFFQRRRGVPRLFLGVYLFMLVFNVIDLLMIAWLAVPGVEVDMADVQEVVRLAVSTTIWGSYFMVSRRVKATFTRSRSGREPAWVGELAAQT